MKMILPSLIITTSIFILSITSSDNETQESECFVVESDTTFKCYKFINDMLHDHCSAQGYCRSTGGRMAIVEGSETWRRVVDKFLKQWGQNVWIGLKVPMGKTDFDYPVNLTKSAHWFENQLSQKYSWSNQDRCVYASYRHDWQWNLTGSCINQLAFLCEYKVPNCNMSEVNIPNADFQNCHTSLLVPLYHSIEVKCWDGYNLIGSKYIKCHLGKWTKPFPKCVAGCSHPGEGPHAQLLLMKDYYGIGEKIAYFCDENYVSWKDCRKTHFILTCEFGGQWSEKFFYCVSVKDSVITTIDINEVHSKVITLQCSLRNSKNVQWLVNGRVIETSLVFSIFYDINTLQIMSLSENTTGIYHCQEDARGNFQLGNTSYHIISHKKCNPDDNVDIEFVERSEGENVLLRCDHICDFGHETWFKNGEKIVDNYHHTTVPRIGFYLKHVTPSDEGDYKCELTCRQNSDTTYCKHIISHQLSVKPSAESVCGIINPSSDVSHYPWVVVISEENENLPFCYGNILNERWIVTSAFCLSAFRHKKTVTNVLVHLIPNNFTAKYPVSLIKIHPMYRSRANQHDIGLIQLKESLPKFSDDIRPVCVSDIDFSFKYMCEKSDQISGTTVGWGSLLVENYTTFATMQSEKMTVVAVDVCKKLSGYSEDIICVNDTDVKENFVADTGSPFLVDHGNRKYLMGIFSWGERVMGFGTYDYFTMVFKYYDWIQHLIKL